MSPTSTAPDQNSARVPWPAVLPPSGALGSRGTTLGRLAEIAQEGVTRARGSGRTKRRSMRSLSHHAKREWLTSPCQRRRALPSAVLRSDRKVRCGHVRRGRARGRGPRAGSAPAPAPGGRRRRPPSESADSPPASRSRPRPRRGATHGLKRRVDEQEASSVERKPGTRRARPGRSRHEPDDEIRWPRASRSRVDGARLHPAHRAAQRDRDAAPGEDARGAPADRRRVAREHVGSAPRSATPPAEGQRRGCAGGAQRHLDAARRRRPRPSSARVRAAGAASASIRARTSTACRMGRMVTACSARTGNAQSARSRAHVERQDVEGQPRLRRLHGASADVDPLGPRPDDPRPGASRERGEIDRQVRLGVRALEEPRHHPGVVVPGRRRRRASRRRRQAAGRRGRPGRGGGRGRRPPGRAGSRTGRPPRAGAEWPAPPAAVPLRTAPGAGARRTSPAGSGTGRAGGAAGRSARARGPRPGTGRSAPCA